VVFLNKMMGGCTTTRVSRQHAFLCVILAAVLCAPRLTAEISPHAREQFVEMRAVAAVPSTVLVNRGGPRLDARQRSAVDTPFIPVPLCGPMSNGGRSLNAIENALPHSQWAADAPTGRSPPIAIS
jgi:hypothetical protein